MRIPYFPLALAGLFLILFSCERTPREGELLRPAPTTGTLVHYGEEEGGKGDARRAWEEQLHRAAPGVNWRAIEYQNAMNQHRIMAQARAAGQGRDGAVSIEEGLLEGYWRERGASNQAGSLHDLAYDPAADALYTVADGGSMWRVEIEEQFWTLINQDLRFQRGLLELVYDAEGNQRIIALVGGRPHYSDDGGNSWLTSEVAGPTLQTSARVRRSTLANDGRIYLLAREDHWADYKLWVSHDNGDSYEMILAPGPNEEIRDIVRPHHSDELLLLRQSNDTSSIALVTMADTLLEINAAENILDDPKLLATVLPDASLQLLTYDDDLLHRSLDTGRTWTVMGDLPEERPWRVGIHQSATDPDYLILGNVNLYFSEDGGQSWDQGAYWADYYDNVLYKLHADMMYFADFQRPDGTYNTFVCSHGGLSINTDSPYDYLNLSLGGLNNAQYYSTATRRDSEDKMFAGSQDQGLQFQQTNFDGVENYEQVISGDYGNLQYSHVSDRLYSMYPFGGLLTYETTFNQYVDWTSVPGGDGFVWITPFTVAPDPEAPSGEVLYLAGGNADGEDAPGSYLIKATDQSSDPYVADYELENVSIDFLDGAGGQLTAVGYSPLDPQRLYVATEEGRFYRSPNGGADWEPTIDFVPEGFYLYGQAILASQLDADRVWFGGSGYSNPAVYQSDDGGETFYSISEGLPQTVVMRLAANPDESMLFAATEAGPYVYVAEEETWYYLGGTAAPAGRYYDVEYLPNSDVARFASYNRGVWDFEVSLDVSSVSEMRQLPDWAAYPNPTNGPVEIQGMPTNAASIRVTDLAGRIVQQNTGVDLSPLPTGVYLLSPRDAAGRPVGKVKRVLRR